MDQSERVPMTGEQYAGYVAEAAWLTDRLERDASNTRGLAMLADALGDVRWLLDHAHITDEAN